MRITNEPHKELKEQPIADDAEIMTLINHLSNAAEKRKDVTIYGVDYTALPLDADGVPIHEGDEMVWCTTPGEWPIKSVIAIASEEFIAYDERVKCYLICTAADYRHYNNQTVDILLRNLGHDWSYSNTDKERTQIIDRYAKRLRLADDTENRE